MSGNIECQVSNLRRRVNRLDRIHEREPFEVIFAESEKYTNKGNKLFVADLSEDEFKRVMDSDMDCVIHHMAEIGKKDEESDELTDKRRVYVANPVIAIISQKSDPITD